METPVKPQFESSGAYGVLVMFHRTDSGFLIQPNYLVKITVSRMSKKELDSKTQSAFDSGADDFNKWIATNHPSLDIWTNKLFCYIRKDIPTPSGELLSISCDVRNNALVGTNVAEAKQIIESIKPLR
jgi:hypothetical protein